MSIKGFSDTSMLKNVLLLIPNETSIKNSKICLIYKKNTVNFLEFCVSGENISIHFQSLPLATKLIQVMTYLFKLFISIYNFLKVKQIHHGKTSCKFVLLIHDNIEVLFIFFLICKTNNNFIKKFIDPNIPEFPWILSISLSFTWYPCW